jgi:uncharacterized protein YdhG (YjbR/CyaY superfamily)
MAGPSTVEEYLAQLPDEARAALEEIRATIRAAAPDASEGISYQIPTFKIHGRALVWYAAFRDHYSLYPATAGLRQKLGEELKAHFSGKGTLRFDAGKPIPKDLIRKIVEVRLEEAAATGRR